MGSAVITANHFPNRVQPIAKGQTLLTKLILSKLQVRRSTLFLNVFWVKVQRLLFQSRILFYRFDTFGSNGTIERGSAQPTD